MSKKQKMLQIIEIKRMVNRTIRGFEGKDTVTKEVNELLSSAYQNLCTAYNVAHGWIKK